eukprot:TRINITY_DN355_c1_g1_i1.p1 TRINITY_DN355_c1_g1~~TRINITY_DN355_c1_g1_i1.p1  ORF type:complete len:105 (-),score=21.25 TRINITY_DN355_c1_g1_i1:212-526(-)
MAFLLQLFQFALAAAEETTKIPSTPEATPAPESSDAQPSSVVTGGMSPTTAILLSILALVLLIAGVAFYSNKQMSEAKRKTKKVLSMKKQKKLNQKFRNDYREN